MPWLSAPEHWAETHPPCPFSQSLLSMRRPPSVIDADALYWLGKHIPNLLTCTCRRRTYSRRIRAKWLPWTGSDTPYGAIRQNRDRPGLAQKTGAIVVLKGAATVLVEPQGRTYLSPYSMPTLAVGGSEMCWPDALLLCSGKAVPPCQLPALGYIGMA